MTGLTSLLRCISKASAKKITDGTGMRTYKILAAIVAVATLSSCGGDSNGSGGMADMALPQTPPVTAPVVAPDPAAPVSRTISVTVAGLLGTGLVLQNNGADNLTFDADGQAAFARPVAQGGAYAVTVVTQPTLPAQICTVGAGAGTAGSATIAVTVTCAARTRLAIVTSLFSSAILAGDPSTGAFTSTGYSVPVGGILPATLSRTGDFLYLTDISANAVRGYSLDPVSGAPTPLPASPFSTGGIAPQASAMSPNGKFLYVANRDSNTLAIFAVNESTGDLTSAGQVPTGGNPISVAVTPNGKTLYICNYTANTISVYNIDANNGMLAAGIAIPTPSPRYTAIDPAGKFLYVTRGNDNVVYGFTIDAATGALTPMSSPFPAGNGTTNLVVEPAGKYLYVSNETDGTASSFTIDATSGALSEVLPRAPTGGLPEGIAVSPTGQYLYVASQTARAVQQFAIDATNGSLSQRSGTSMSAPPIAIVIR